MRCIQVARSSLILLACLTAGCSSLLPSRSTHTTSQWKNFNEAQTAYNKVEAGKTNTEELKELGYDPHNEPNIAIENYLTVRDRFDPRGNGKLLPQAVNECLFILEHCKAYVAKTGFSYEKRVGNAFMDIVGIHRETFRRAWVFEAIFIIQNDVVVYKLWAGAPKREIHIHETKPLGPLQDLGGSVNKVVNLVI